MSAETANQNALAVGRNFVWHECYVPNVESAVDFYTKTLNFGSQSMDMGDFGTYTMLTRDGVPVCGVLSTDMPQLHGVPPHWSVYLSVDDVDARIAAVTQSGGTVVVPPMDIPSIGRMALIADPQGAHLWLFKPEMPG